MREVFDDEDELPPTLRPRDTEVTQGPMAVSGLIFALLLLCGLCFGLGYSMGSRGSKSALKAVQSPVAPASDAASAASKPGAVTPKISTAQPASTQTVASATPAAAPQSADLSSAQPAGAPLSPLMVQIATVSNHEDADVLVGALHKRGYAVSLSQDATDNQFHVRVGPFASLSEATAIRQKLLNDGYNAVVQP
jgi:cell division septation protein DedD